MNHPASYGNYLSAYNHTNQNQYQQQQQHTPRNVHQHAFDTSLVAEAPPRTVSPSTIMAALNAGTSLPRVGHNLHASLTPSTNPEGYSLTARASIHSSRPASNSLYGSTSSQNTLTSTPQAFLPATVSSSYHQKHPTAVHPTAVHTTPTLTSTSSQQTYFDPVYYSTPGRSDISPSQTFLTNVSRIDLDGSPTIHATPSAQQTMAGMQSAQSMLADRARLAYDTLESILFSLKPAVHEGDPRSIADRVQKAEMLDQAFAEFKDFFLLNDEHSTQVFKNERKHGLALDTNTQPPLKRSSNPPSAIPHHVSQHAERPLMPALSHTQSSPVVPTQSRYPAAEAFPHLANSMSNTPGTDAAVAGVHLPLEYTPSTSPSLIGQVAPAARQISINIPSSALVSSAPAQYMQSSAAASELSSGMAPPNQQPSVPRNLINLTQLNNKDLMPVDHVIHSQPSSPTTLMNFNPPFAAMTDIAVPRQPPNPRSLDIRTDGLPPVESFGTPDLTSPELAYKTHFSRKSLSDDLSTSSPVGTRSRANTVGSSSGLQMIESRQGSPMLLEEESSSNAHGKIADEPLPAETREQMDAVFEPWLQQICSNVDIMDSKGEPIHQKLMAKKMNKLDEQGEYRPFRFRIQAFSNSFTEALTRSGFPQELISTKTIRAYLWFQPLISRFNEEGKKSKSKGNHVWSLDAKKIGPDQWHFRPWERRIILPAQNTAWCGHSWKWDARIWDGQRAAVAANFSSPSLPSFLSWKPGKGSLNITELSGDIPFAIPGQGETTHRIEVHANFEIDGQAEQISAAFDLHISASGSIPEPTPLSSAVNTPQQPSASTFSVPDLLQPAMHISPEGLSAASPPMTVSLAQIAQASDPSVHSDGIAAMLSTDMLLAAEQQVVGNSGPLASALTQRENAIAAFNMAVTLPESNSRPEIIAALANNANIAEDNAQRAVNEAHTQALQSLAAGYST